MNGWNDNPYEVKKCRNLKHVTKDNLYSISGSYNIVFCEICKYYYNYDCS